MSRKGLRAPTDRKLRRIDSFRFFDQDFGGGFGGEDQRMDVDAGLDTEARVRQEVEDARARLDAFFGGFSVSPT